MLITLIIGGAIFLITLIFNDFWKSVVACCLAQLVVGVIKGIITLVRRGSRVISRLFRRWRDGKITVKEVPDKVVDIDDCPPEVQNRLRTGEVVMEECDN
jgi:hypothetical protein